jgi:hypothetical protein
MCSSSLIYLLDLGEVMEEVMGRGLVNSLATKNAVLVTVTRLCFCCCDFFEGELWCHDPLCCAVLLVVAMALAFECFPPWSHTGQGGCKRLLSCGITMMFWCYQCHLVKARIPLLAGFIVPAILPMNTMVMVPKRQHLSHISYGTWGQPSVHSHTYSHEESI